MTIMLMGAISNVILDPLFFFVFKMGVVGAAWATVIGQFLNCYFGVRLFLLGRTSIKLVLKDPSLNFSIVRETLLLDLSTFIRLSGQSTVVVIVNNLLGSYGGYLYISAYGVTNKLILFLMMPLLGTVQGLQPIAGYNFGAKKFDRVKRALGVTTLFSTVLHRSLFFSFFFFPIFLRESLPPVQPFWKSQPWFSTFFFAA